MRLYFAARVGATPSHIEKLVKSELTKMIQGLSLPIFDTLACSLTSPDTGTSTYDTSAPGYGTASSFFSPTLSATRSRETMLYEATVAVASSMSWLTLSASDPTDLDNSDLRDSKMSCGTVTSRVIASPYRRAAA